MAMTKTRRKQKQDVMRRAMCEAEQRQCELREQFRMRSTAVPLQCCWEPALIAHSSQQSANADDDGYASVMFLMS